MTDPIADMLTRIRNAIAVRKQEVVIPFSKIKFEIAQILKKEGYIEKLEKKQDNFTQIRIGLKYSKDNGLVIQSLKRISKPGRRVYTGKDELPRVLNDLGIAIISTSQGLMTNREAKKRGIGGEVLCEIY